MLRPKKSCKDAALSLLARREHSGAEIKRKLAQKGYDKREIAEIADYFKEIDYLSDERFACAFARELIERKLSSDRAALAKLTARGVLREEAEEAVRMAAELLPEELRVERLLAKWGKTAPEDGRDDEESGESGANDGYESHAESRDERKKIIAKLLRLGYSYEVVKLGLKVDERR